MLFYTENCKTILVSSDAIIESMRAGELEVSNMRIRDNKLEFYRPPVRDRKGGILESAKLLGKQIYPITCVDNAIDQKAMYLIELDSDNYSYALYIPDDVVGISKYGFTDSNTGLLKLILELTGLNYGGYLYKKDPFIDLKIIGGKNLEYGANLLNKLVLRTLDLREFNTSKLHDFDRGLSVIAQTVLLPDKMFSHRLWEETPNEIFRGARLSYLDCSVFSKSFWSKIKNEKLAYMFHIANIEYMNIGEVDLTKFSYHVIQKMFLGARIGTMKVYNAENEKYIRGIEKTGEFIVDSFAYANL